MEILGLMQQERMTAIEERRKVLQRKNVGDVYRKNLQYAQPKKNPVLIELENLLLGHKDYDLYAKHKEESQTMTPKEQATLQEMEQAKKNVRAHELTHKTLDGENNSGISHAQQLDYASNIEITQVANRITLIGTETEEIIDVNDEPIELEIPERFSKELKLDPFADTIFGRSYEELYRESLFKKAAATYTTHSEMAKNGYRPGNEPTFSMTA